MDKAIEVPREGQASRPIRDSIRLASWKHRASTELPNYPAHLYSDIHSAAIASVGMVPHRGGAWEAKVNALARDMMNQIGIPWEDRAGSLYIAGRRVWWSNQGRFEQD